LIRCCTSRVLRRTRAPCYIYDKALALTNGGSTWNPGISTGTNFLFDATSYLWQSQLVTERSNHRKMDFSKGPQD
jgi:hypothetical protein